MINRLLVPLLLAAAAPALAQSPMRDMLDVSELARFRPVEVGMFSSYDRTGGNDDGFSGAHSFLRKEGDALVIAELEGPGALTRIWTPTPIDAPIEFYFDGEERPRIALPFRQLFSGRQAPFTGELVGHGLGGFYSLVPIEFAKSMKVVVRAPKLQFYQINFARYATGTRIESYPGDRLQVRGHGQGKRIEGRASLEAGGAVTLYEVEGPGRIHELRLGPAEAFAGPDRDIDLRITWDGARTPAVQMPVSEFFGYSFGDPATRSLLFGTEGGWNYSRLPMPFSRSAKVELVSRRRVPVEVRSELVVSDEGRSSQEGFLHAGWRREAHTTKGVPFSYPEIAGRGHVVGFTLQVQGAQPGNTGFFEGDEQVTIDGKLAIHGTGTEDMFSGGWYGLPGRWNDRGSLPFHGALDYSRQLGRTGGYRLLLGDAYSFERSLRFTVEHGPERNSDDGDYAGTLFYYLDRAEGVAPEAGLKTAVVPAGGFRQEMFPLAGLDTLIDASLTPGGGETDTGWVPFMTFARSTGANAGGQPSRSGTVFNDTWGPPSLVLRVEAPQDGRYAILVDAFTGPDSAMLQLHENGQPLGRAYDFYAPAPGRSGPAEIGEVTLRAGFNTLHLTMPGRNPAATGVKIDLISIEGRLVRRAD